VNCAVYTRKSSDEGLEQEFNSLDAQREACEAYILSQKHACWSVLPQMYDDGGLSGGTMERPALLRLLDDVRAGKVKVIVVYKVDRLTRSLSDFAKIVEILDAHGASFVSVTQQFNTTTSMGRLTLNVLLSFAQFEREIAGERIRDKIAASKRRGMWMGGNVPLGYDAVDRKLVVNEAEAEAVRFIFARYAELGSVALLQNELDRAKIVGKPRRNRIGRCTGARRFSRGALYLMLQNRIYRGEIVHRGAAYPGLHEAIIKEPVWDAVQERLAANRNDRLAGKGVAQPSLLAGRIFDAAGRPMTPSHAVRKAKRYRYYVSNIEAMGGENKSFDGQRIPAGDIEALVLNRLRTLFESPRELTGLLAEDELEAAALSAALANAAGLAGRLPTLCIAELGKLVDAAVKRIEVRAETVRIVVSRLGVLYALDHDRGRALPGDSPRNDLTVLEVASRLARVGKGMRIVVGDEALRQPEVDGALTRLLGEAFWLRDELLSGRDNSIEAMSARLDLAKGYLTSRIRLTYIAPDIISAIFVGRQPIGLSTSRLLASARDLPNDWAEQRKHLGFTAG
jgi:DNA invertase Pin-like site-specific DNA recombinase